MSGKRFVRSGRPVPLPEPFRSGYTKVLAGFTGDVPGPDLSTANDPGAVHTPVR